MSNASSPIAIRELAFDSLRSQAEEVMQIVCFLDSSAIPQTLFEPECNNDQTSYEILQDVTTLEDAILELEKLRLVQRDKATGMLKVGQLTQTEYLNGLPEGVWWASFRMTTLLVRRSFPKQNTGHFYTLWSKCSPLHHHILALQRRLQYRSRVEIARLCPPEFLELALDHIWYMIETQHFKNAELSTLMLLSKIQDDRSSSIRIHRNLMTIYERTGRSSKALESATSELSQFPDWGPNKDNNYANACSDMGYALVSAMKPRDALHYLDTAIEIAMQDKGADLCKTYNIDRFLRNRARAKLQLGQFEEALLDLDQADEYQIEIHGKGSHYEGETKHERAKIAASQGDLSTAYKLNLEALNLVSTGKPTHSSVMASQYRLGWVCLLQGNGDQALDHLNKALVICQLNEAHRGNSGESARVKRLLGQIYLRKGMEPEARAYSDAAEKCKAELVATGDYAIPEDENASWDALLGLLYR